MIKLPRAVDNPQGIEGLSPCLELGCQQPEEPLPAREKPGNTSEYLPEFHSLKEKWARGCGARLSDWQMWESLIVPESTSHLATFSFSSTEYFLLAVLKWSVASVSISQPFSPERGANDEGLMAKRFLCGEVRKEFLNQRRSLWSSGVGALSSTPYLRKFRHFWCFGWRLGTIDSCSNPNATTVSCEIWAS